MWKTDVDANGDVMVLGIASAPFHYGGQVVGTLGLHLFDEGGGETTSATYSGRGAGLGIEE
jgi:hypothetical protein